MVERTLISLPSQLQLIDRLQHLIYLSSSLIFVSGEAGSGKSTLTENLSNALDTDLQQIYLSLSPAVSADKMRQQIVGQLYDQPLFNPEENLLDTVLRLQASESKENKKLLIIDNANNLPEGFIIELCELFSGEDFVRDSTFNIVLLGDEKTNQAHLEYIEDNLIGRMQAALNDVEFKLPPLTDEESFSLLQHHFQQAKYHPDVDNEEGITKQLKACDGNPKRIIQLANTLTQENVIPARRYWLKTALPAVLMMLLLVALVSALGTYLYPRFIAQSEVLTDEADIIAANKAQRNAFLEHHLIQEERMEEALAAAWNEDEVGIDDNPQQVGQADKDGSRVVVNDQEITAITELLADKSESEAQKTTDSQNNASTEKEASQANSPESVTYRLPAKKLTPVDPIQLSPSDEGASLNNNKSDVITEKDSQQIEDNKTLLSSIKETVGLGAVDENAVEPLKNIEEPSKPEVSAPIVNLPSVAKPALVATTTLQEVTSDPADTTVKAPITDTEVQEAPPIKAVANGLTPDAVLLSKSALRYTLQLSGMATQRYVDLFKQQSNFPRENLFLYQTTYQNKPWFVVLYGDYESVSAAQVAAKNLPGALKGMQSWVKQWQLVHNELRLNNE